jgi:glycosyltransferase involved in cell wall biosynthesis
MSRIIKNKGIEMIIEFAKQTNIDLTIDFYGQINPNIKVFFNSSLNTCAKINYKGYLQPEIINEVLAQYDVLLLPTKFYTEGLPGAIVDAYFSGIPVIVTRWLHAEEFVIHEKTGFIIPFEQGENDFKYYIEKLHNDRKLLDLMKTNARNESLKFTSDVAWQNFKKINKQ